MRVLIAVVVVLLLMSITALAVLWLIPPRSAVVPAGAANRDQYQKIAGAVTLGIGGYAGGTQGAAAASDLARGAGWL